MNIEELTAIWNTDETINKDAVAINRKLLKTVTVHEIKSLLGELKWNWIIEIIINALFFPFIMQFVIVHVQSPAFLIPGLISLAINLSGLIVAIYKMKTFMELSPQASVLLNQLKLARLKYIESMEVNSLFVVIPVFSAPILIVLAKGLLGFDLYLLGDWVLNYTLGSLVIGAIVAFIIKKFPSRKLEQAIALFRDIKEIEK